MTIQDIVGATQGVLVMGDPKMNVGGTGHVSIDSRTLKRGDIFFALKGEKTNGHDHLENCFKKGAALCVVSKIPNNTTSNAPGNIALLKVRDTKRSLADVAKLYRKQYGEKIQRTGISGSCGKTTVKDMLTGILSSTASTVSSPGNFNNEIGCPLSVLGLLSSHVYGVFEIGASAKGEVGRLSEIVAPHVAVITNISLEHSETFGTLEEIAEGECEILSALMDGGTAVLPIEDDFFKTMIGKLPIGKDFHTKTFGLSPKANVYAKEISIWPGPSKFILVHQDDNGRILDEFPCELPVLGRFNVLNACAAAAAAFALKVPSKNISKGLGNYSQSPMRFQVLKLKEDIVIVNDAYNASPGSVRTSVESFVEVFSNKRLVIVLGDMLELGESSSREHEALGTYLAGFPISKIILFGSQSRFTLTGITKALVNAESVIHCQDRDTLLSALEKSMEPGTAVLFKASRGIHLEEIVHILTNRYS